MPKNIKEMWKNLRFFSKILFFINLIFGVLLLFAYLLPYIPPKNFPLSSLSLFTPIILICNVLFFFYWVMRWKRNALVSGILLVFGLPFFDRFFKFSSEEIVTEQRQIRLMTFNVRVFNHYNWHKDTEIHTKIVDFIKDKHPNLLAIQEFHKIENESFDFYKYKKIIYKNPKDRIGQAILSDFPILNSGSLDFPNTGNNGVFADILIETDTIRLYSLHFESFHMNNEEKMLHLSQEETEKMFLNLGRRFALQQSQVEIFDKHREKSPYPTLVCGDFNNTAFSYLYRKIKSDNLQDSFQEQGKGLGRTFNFPYFPFRIDYIFVDTLYQVSGHKVHSDIHYSDHFPVEATFFKANKTE